MTLRFLAAEAGLEDAQAVIQGLPYDGGVSFRPGASLGPAAVREMSDSLETWSPDTGRDLEDIRLHDAGDVPLAGLDAEAVMEAIAASTERLLATGAFLVSVGGDHSVSIGTAEGIRRAHPDIAHVVLDAHLDMRAAYDGSPFSHACGTWQMSEREPTVLLGARSGSREEWEDGAKRLLALRRDLVVPEDAAEVLRGRPVHVSLDLDVLDTSALPGTGTPEPGGVTFRELHACLLDLAARFRIVAVDLVELAPPFDPSGVSAVVAAKLARDLICARAGR